MRVLDKGGRWTDTQTGDTRREKDPLDERLPSRASNELNLWH